MIFPTKDFTNQFISSSYQDVLQQYLLDDTLYFLDGYGNVVGSIPSSSIGYNLITSDVTSSMTVLSSSHALTASYAFVSASIINYDGNRPITRTGYVGLNVGGTDLTTFIENFFFPFVPATVSINSSTLNYETGSIQSIVINGSITANNETIFGITGSVKSSTYEVSTFPSASTYSVTDTNISSSNTYRSYISVNNNGSPIIISSTTKTVNFIYPYLWGMSTTAGLSGNSLYTEFTRQIQSQGNKTVSMIGTAKYIYFCYPASYPALSSILDPNLFQAISSFEYSASVPVTSSGLSTDWMTSYKVYRTKLISDPNGNFQFIY